MTKLDKPLMSDLEFKSAIEDLPRFTGKNQFT